MFHIVLVHPDIPQNTGNVGRLCVGIEATLHLVHPMSFIIDDKKLKRAGLDYWKNVSLVEHDSLEKFLAYQKNTGGAMHLFSTKAQRTHFEAEFKRGDWLVFGSESRGLPPEFLQEHFARALRLPMTGPIRSLNLSTSVGIAAYEALRQNR